MAAYQVPTDPTTVMGRRIGAYLIDIVILIALGWVLTALLTDSTTSSFNPCPEPVTGEQQFQMCTVDDGWVVWDGDEAVVTEFSGSFTIVLINLAYAVAVFVVFQGITGMTPGKAATGIRTVNQEGEAPGLGKAFVRWILWIVDAFPYCCFVPVVGGISAFASKGHRRVGDMAAKTFVVRKDAMGTPVAVPGLTTAPQLPDAVTTPPLTMSPSPATTATEPQWDPQRNAYIQWDPDRQVWLQHDPVEGWKPIT